MKKKYILSMIVLLTLSVVLFFLITFSKSSILSTEGYFITDDKIDEVLLSNKKVAKSKNISLSKVDYDDDFYTNLGNLYVGDEKKSYVNDDYPIFSRDGLSVVNINEKSKLITSKFDIYSGYENSTITGGKLYNYNDSQQADFEDYIFLQLPNVTYVNLYEMKIDNIVNSYVIPVNSIMVFYEDYIKYYYFSNEGLFVYDIIDGLDYTTDITMGDNKYDYVQLLEFFNIISINDDDNEDLLEEDNSLVEEDSSSSSDEEEEYVKPKVEVVEQFKANVYSAIAKIKISDPSGVIINGVNFQFKIGDKIYSRKAFMSSGEIKVIGLVPNTTFKIVGSYKYYNKERKKIESTFFEQEITTLDASSLEPIDLSFENGKIYSDKIELNNLKINSSFSNEAINGINKAIIIINGDEYLISNSLLSKIVNNKSVTYTSPNNIDSNSNINYEIKFFDSFDNIIKVTNNTGQTRTAKKTPTVNIKRTSEELNLTKFSIKLINEDDVYISSYRYVVYDINMNIKFSGELENIDSQGIELDNLEPSSLYYLKVLGDFDIEDGNGVLENQVIGEAKFATDSLSSLGAIKLNSEIIEIRNDGAYLKNLIDFNHTSSILLQLVNSFSVVVTDSDGVEWFNKNFESIEELAEIMSDEFFIDINNLNSSTNVYNIEFFATAKQGDAVEKIVVECPLTEIRLLKKDAHVNVTNYFVTNNMITFDVEVVDNDNAILDSIVTMKVFDENSTYIDVVEIEKGRAPITIKYDNLYYGNTGKYKFYFTASSYNVGYDSGYFESDKELIEGGLELGLNKDIYGNIQMTGLERIVTGSNYFNIVDDQKYRTTVTEGAVGEKSFNDNILTLGSSNGITNISYYILELLGNKKVSVSFEAKYKSSSVGNGDVYFKNGYDVKIRDSDEKLNGLNKDDYTKYSYVINAKSPYFGFVIEEMEGLNQTTSIEIKNLMITTSFKNDDTGQSFKQYSESDRYNGLFDLDLSYKRIDDGSINIDGNYYISVCTNVECEYLSEGDGKIFQTKEAVLDVIYKLSPKYTKEFAKNKNLTLKLSYLGSNGVFYDLDIIEFSTISEIYAIDSSIDFQNIHSNGRYIVLKDLDFTGRIDDYFYGTFYGEIDFQGHKITLPINKSLSGGWSSNYLIYIMAAGSKLKNVVVDYNLNNSSTRNYNFRGLAFINSGLLDNVYININNSSGIDLSEAALIAHTNRGTIQNFVIYNNVSNVVVERDFGLVSYNNIGVIKNGYVAGEDIVSSHQTSPDYYGKAVGSIAALNFGKISNVFSLVSVRSDISDEEDKKVGNIVGTNSGGTIENSFSVEDPKKYVSSNIPNALDKDPNIGFKMGDKGIFKNLYYSSDNNYENSESKKIVKATLYQEKFYDNYLNSDKAFEVDRYVSIGAYPQVILNSCMPRQKFLFLPEINDVDNITISSSQQILADANNGIFKLQLNNINQQSISSISVDGISSSECNSFEERNIDGEVVNVCKIDPDNKPTSSKVWILSQSNYDNSKTELMVQVYKVINDGVDPTDFKSTTVIDSVISLLNGISVDNEIDDTINFSLYYPISDIDDWKLMNEYPSGNFMLMNDLDFKSNRSTCNDEDCYLDVLDYAIQTEFSGKLDGGNHIVSNFHIKSEDKLFGMFEKVTGGTIQNLYIDNYSKVNDASTDGYHYGGLIRIAENDSIIDNVHMANSKVYGDYKTGGLVAEVASKTTITNCSISNTSLSVRTTIDSNLSKIIGGLVAEASNVSISNSYVDNISIEIDDVFSAVGIGGVVGDLIGGTIENVYATGIIDVKSSIVGGIAGRFHGEAIIRNVWSGINIYSTMDCIGGVVGRYQEGSEGVYNTLVVGDVSSTYDANTINRTIGNAFSTSKNNYAWDGQKFNGIVSTSGSIETFLNLGELQNKDSYFNIGFSEDDFSFDNLSDGDNAVLPLVKNSKTGKILNEGISKFEQPKFKIKYDEINVRDIVVGTDTSGDYIKVTINDPEGKIKRVENITNNSTNITNIKFDYIVPEASVFTIEIADVDNNVKNIIIRDFKFTRAYDAYILEKISINDMEIILNSKIDYCHYNYITNAKDWYSYFDDTSSEVDYYGNKYGDKKTTGENFLIDLEQGLDELKLNKFIDGIVIGRLDYENNGNKDKVIINLDGMSVPESAKSLSFINIINRSLKNIEFCNINFKTISNSSNQGFIRMVNGTVDNIVFKNIKLQAPNGATNGCFGRFYGDKISNVSIDADNNNSLTYENIGDFSNHITAKYQVGGIIAYKASYSEVSNLSVADTYVLADCSENCPTTTPHYTGGVIGVIEGGYSDKVYNLDISDSYVRSTRSNQEYTGGLVGFGGASGYENITTGKVEYSTVENTIVSSNYARYVGGAFGRSYSSADYIKVNNVEIKAGGSTNVGGIAGVAIKVTNSYVSDINMIGNWNVGGICGSMQSSVSLVSNSGVDNADINFIGSSIGGIVGYITSTGTVENSYITNSDISSDSIGESSHIGGIIGQLGQSTTGGKLTNVLANVNIYLDSTANKVGGIIGGIIVISPSSNNSSLVTGAILANSTINVNKSASNVGLFVGHSVGRIFSSKFDKLLLDGKINLSNNDSSISNVGYIEGYYEKEYASPSRAFVTSDSIVPNISSCDQCDMINRDRLKQPSFYNGDSSGMNYSKFITSWDGGSVSNGYFAKVNYSMPNINIYPDTNSITNTSLSTFSLKAGLARNYELPNIKVYSSDVDKFNIDFDDINNNTYFVVYENGKKVFAADVLNKTYTFAYNYQSDIEIYLNNGFNNKTYSYKANDLINGASVYGDRYAYLYNDKLLGNIKAVKGNFIHVFDDKALTVNGDIYDISEQVFISYDNDLSIKALADIKSLYSFNYEKSKIRTYGSYSIINKNGETIYYDKQIYVKNDNFEIIDSDLDYFSNSVIVDGYAKNNYVTVLGKDGRIYDLKSSVKLPSDFDNNNIRFMSNNINAKNSIVVIVYNSGKVVVFDYRTGRIVREKKATEDISIVEYFKRSFSSKKAAINENISDKYIDAIDLKNKLEENPIVGNEGNYSVDEKSDSKEDYNISSDQKYVVYYNATKNKYDVIDIGDVINTDNNKVVITENDKIYSSSDLVHFYSNKSIFDKIFGEVNVLLLLAIILLGIICSLILWYTNIRNLKERRS